jgi:hypothetical protein
MFRLNDSSRGSILIFHSNRLYSDREKKETEGFFTVSVNSLHSFCLQIFNFSSQPHLTCVCDYIIVLSYNGVSVCSLINFAVQVIGGVLPYAQKCNKSCFIVGGVFSCDISCTDFV